MFEGICILYLMDSLDKYGVLCWRSFFLRILQALLQCFETSSVAVKYSKATVTSDFCMYNFF